MSPSLFIKLDNPTGLASGEGEVESQEFIFKIFAPVKLLFSYNCERREIQEIQVDHEDATWLGTRQLYL